MKSVLRAAAVAMALSATSLAQPPQFSNTVRGFIKIDAPVVALTNVRVIDGTGAPAKESQTIVPRAGHEVHNDHKRSLWSS